MTDCIFCKIIKGEIPCTKIYEDTSTLAFLDANPRNLGHALVIPKKHFETLDKIGERDLQTTIKIVQKVAKVISKISKGYNLIQNNKKIAGQIVPHIHFHIIPRENENELSWTPPKKYSKKETKNMQEKIKTLLK